MDKIAEAVAKALKDTNKLHKIDDDEAERLAVLVATVVKSEKHLRMVFYSGVQVIALRIQEILKKQEIELLKKMKGSMDDGNKGDDKDDNKDDILN
jgi:uncharacterized protein (UPF0218 family)